MNQNIIITSAGLNLVKSIYKHIELLNVLSRYSFEIVLGMFKSFWFYVFTVFYMFGDVEMQRILLSDSIPAEFESLKQLQKTQWSDKIDFLISTI